MPRSNKYATIKDLIRHIKKSTGYDEKLIADVLHLYFEAIKDGVASKKQVRLSNFGIFSQTVWKSNTYFDPNSRSKTNKQIKTVSFKPSKTLKRKAKES